MNASDLLDENKMRKVEESAGILRQNMQAKRNAVAKKKLENTDNLQRLNRMGEMGVNEVEKFGIIQEDGEFL